MAEPKTKAVKRIRWDGGYQNLLLHLQNSTTDVFVLEFPDAKTAKVFSTRIASEVVRHDWYSLVVTLRGSKIYVVNTRCAQRVVLDEVL